MTDNIISVQQLTKSFGSHKALDNCSFEIKKGEIFGSKWSWKNNDN